MLGRVVEGLSDTSLANPRIEIIHPGTGLPTVLAHKHLACAWRWSREIDRA